MSLCNILLERINQAKSDNQLLNQLGSPIIDSGKEALN